MTKKPKRGRPPKDDADKVNQSIYVRAHPEMRAAIAKFQSDNGFSTASEAVRQLMLRALKAEGLL